MLIRVYQAVLRQVWTNRATWLTRQAWLPVSKNILLLYAFCASLEQNFRCSFWIYQASSQCRQSKSCPTSWTSSGFKGINLFHCNCCDGKPFALNWDGLSDLCIAKQMHIASSHNNTMVWLSTLSVFWILLCCRVSISWPSAKSTMQPHKIRLALSFLWRSQSMRYEILILVS